MTQAQWPEAQVLRLDAEGLSRTEFLSGNGARLAAATRWLQPSSGEWITSISLAPPSEPPGYPPAHAKAILEALQAALDEMPALEARASAHLP